MNNDAKNIGVQISKIPISGSMFLWMLDYMVVLLLFEEPPYYFIIVVPVDISNGSVQRFSIILPTLLNYIPPSRYEAESHCVSDLHFLMISDMRAIDY